LNDTFVSIQANVDAYYQSKHLSRARRDAEFRVEYSFARLLEFVVFLDEHFGRLLRDRSRRPTLRLIRTTVTGAGCSVPGEQSEQDVQFGEAPVTVEAQTMAQLEIDGVERLTDANGSATYAL
jgi:hypothetical protein